MAELASACSQTYVNSPGTNRSILSRDSVKMHFNGSNGRHFEKCSSILGGTIQEYQNGRISIYMSTNI